MAKAVYHRLGGRAVLSHQSALLVHGVEISDVDLSCVHITRLSGCGRRGESVRQHASRPPVTDPVEVDGVDPVLVIRRIRLAIERSLRRAAR
jgi:hypothetical protein